MLMRALTATITLGLLRQIFIFIALLSLLGSELAKAQTHYCPVDDSGAGGN